MRLPTGVFPKVRSEYALDVIGRALFRALSSRAATSSPALMNAGPIIHPPLITMNARPIEHFERWDIHKEGHAAGDPSCHRPTRRRAHALAKANGAPHFPLADHYAKAEWMYEREAHDTLTDSGDWRERLVPRSIATCWKTCASGLSFIVSMAELPDVPTPLPAPSCRSLGDLRRGFHDDGTHAGNARSRWNEQSQPALLLDKGF